jgi:hypothetical protein
LFDSCYENMFRNCSELIDIGNINAAWFAARTPAQDGMLFSCSKITTPITYANIPIPWR